MTRRRLKAALALGVALAACAGPDGSPRTSQVTWAPLADGTYRAVAAAGYAAGDSARVLAITAQLDRAAGRVVFTLADSSQRTLTFTSRERSAWKSDCFTGAGGPPSWVNGEVADLSPAPLHLESLTFAAPVVYAKCSPTRMILTDQLDESSATTYLVLDRS